MPSRVFSATTFPPIKTKNDIDEQRKSVVLKVSREKYSRPVEFVEKKILEFNKKIIEDEKRFRKEEAEYKERMKEEKARKKLEEMGSPRLAPQSDPQDLKQKFQKASLLCHPDKFQGNMKNQAEKIFIELRKAYEANDTAKVTSMLAELENGLLLQSNPQQKEKPPQQEQANQQQNQQRSGNRNNHRNKKR